jgi:hypothetical protein
MTKANKIGEIRRSQMVQIYGPGSIINLKQGDASISALMTDLSTWDLTSDTEKTREQRFLDRRLSKSIEVLYEKKVDWFRLPPVEPEPEKQWLEKKSSLIGNIFPKTFICPNQYHRRVGTIDETWVDRKDRKDARYVCTNCTGHGEPVFLVPSRFIVACAAGHLQEFPYRMWLDEKGILPKKKKKEWKGKTCRHKCITLNQERGLGLRGLYLRCSKDIYDEDGDFCGRFTSMDGIFAQKSLPLGCDGESPWIMDYKDHIDDCKKDPKALQRNSVSVWQSKTVSALTIPPWDNRIKNLLSSKRWSDITRRSDAESRASYVKIIFEDIENDFKEKDKILPYSLEELIAAIEEEIENDSNVSPDLKTDEYNALTDFDEHRKIDDFQVRSEDIPLDSKIQNLIERVLIVNRLREVRALVQFTRMKKDEQEVIPVDLTRDKTIKWLPVIEIFGEGIFLQFKKNTIDKFLSSSDIIESIEYLYKETLNKQVLKRIILHTFSHLFMRAVAVESGYSLASIAERIYDGNDQYGILIYTSTNDSEGTLGGLSRLGKQERLGPIINQCLEFSTLCSNDPLCFDGLLSQDDPTNGAACHSCLLVPETSCEDYNSNLSRTIIESLYQRL